MSREGQVLIGTWERLLGRYANLFTRPSAALFTILVGAWGLCPGRHTAPG